MRYPFPFFRLVTPDPYIQFTGLKRFGFHCILPIPYNRLITPRTIPRGSHGPGFLYPGD